ncbi:tryptophan synthase subunit alpha [Candidatus Pantoea edessiphila]|uniref:Tryptophan synthase alpha chain n=1 Tax=Candidatus Pantoea edessiphila TaxID=2044610 RepID=A0A2P5SWR0_9GAMM|nr:tryptophan synthase subunit alpha [Candidatus Pantoea edessiphila]PPI86777.1 tryptophan synthase subunit alpha [Candidatus Pantoea edessiphila]
MKRYNILFKRLKNSNEGAFFPFVVLGDPSPLLSLKIIDILIENGADGLELGIPFSDPLVDGPVIQNAHMRAFNSGITVKKSFKMITDIRDKYSDLPIGLLTYANLVFNNGIENFYIRCSELNVDSVLIADLPIEESEVFSQKALQYNINPIFVCPPNPSDNLLREISVRSYGYVYLLSRSGVTGTEKPASLTSQQVINKLRLYNAAPLMQGFGISNINQAKKIILTGVDGIIIGSAIIKVIENNYKKIDLMLNKLKILANKFKSASLKLC